MTELTIGERLAVVETRVEEIHEQAKERSAKQDEILDKINKLVLDQSSIKSFMGGAMWIGTAMITVLWHIFPWLWNLIKGKISG